MQSWIEPLESRQLLSGSPNLAMSASQLVFSQVAGTTTAYQQIKLKNTGSAKLALGSISIGGADASEFTLSMKRMPTKLGHGATYSVKVAFKPTAAGLANATLDVASNDPDMAVCSVPLRGLGTDGVFEAHEPSLQHILDTFRIPVNVGDLDPSTGVLDGPGPSDEVPLQLMHKAGKGPVRITPIASYSWDSSPVAQFGWYSPAPSGPVNHKLFTIPAHATETLMPRTTGTTKFDPGNAVFGLYSTWPYQAHGPVYTQDGRNTWASPTGTDHQHEVRFYPYKTPDGKTVANTYVAAVEEAFNSDFQDAVFIISNVAPL